MSTVESGGFGDDSERITNVLKRVVRNASFSAVAAVGQAATGIVYAGLAVRFLGMGLAGYLLGLQSLLSVFGRMGGFGLTAAATRRVALLRTSGTPAESRRCLGVVLSVSVLSGALVAIFLSGGFRWVFAWSRLAPHDRQDAYQATLLVAAAFVFQQAGATLETAYAAFERFDLQAITGPVSGVILAILGFGLLVVSPTLTAQAGLLLVLKVGQFVAASLFCRQLLGGPVFPRCDWVELMRLSLFGRWVYAESLAALLTAEFDRLLLTALFGSAALPPYAIGQKVVQLVHGVLSGHVQFVFPMIASFGEAAREFVLRVQDRLRWFVAFEAALCYGGLATAAFPLLAILAGRSFAAQAYGLFLLACVQGFFSAQGIAPYLLLWAQGKGTPGAVSVLVSGFLVAITAVILCPRLGAIGAALAQLWVGPVTILFNVWAARYHGVLTVRTLFRPLVSPCAVFLSLLLTARVLPSLVAMGPASQVLAAGILLGSAASAGLWLEKLAFPADGALPTLRRCLAEFLPWRVGGDD